MDIKQEEQKILLEHEYDGIQELDNLLPSWWKNMFYVTIAFAVFYLSGHHLVGWFDSQEAQYLKEMADYEASEQASAKMTLTEEQALQDKTLIEAGWKIFAENCVLCHGVAAEGKIGPNLTDKYWLYGEGTLQDVMTTITNGVSKNGMPGWKMTLGKKKILQVATFVLSLRGSNPPNPKPPQGNAIEKK